MRIGVDLGGTKIEIAALDLNGTVRLRERINSPSHSYENSVRAIAELVVSAERKIGATCTIGLGIPGTISPATGLVKNANSTALNGKPFKQDLEHALGQPVRIANDANCFALSEAVDGAGKDHRTVFGVILGTGVGGGITVQGTVLEGPNSITGEWGHNALPWPDRAELPGHPCYCGKSGCIETWLSGPSISRRFHVATGRNMSASDVAALAVAGDKAAATEFESYHRRLAKSLAHVCNLLDPDIIVLGGGLSNIDRLYSSTPGLIMNHVFSDAFTTPIVKNRWGDSGGVRGAAWLWPAATT